MNWAWSCRYIAARPAKVTARQSAQCTRLRRLMAAIPLTSVSAAMMAKANCMSGGVTIGAMRGVSLRVQGAAEQRIGHGDHGGAERPADEQRAREIPDGGEMPDTGDDQIQQRHRQEEFPGEIEKLVHAQARHGAADPDEEAHQGHELEDEPDVGRDHLERFDGRMPAAEEE